MLPGLVHALRCPHCAASVALAGASVRCEQGHAYDLARQGYVNLLGAHRPPGAGDTAAMVERRAAFLAAGHYTPITEAIERAAGAVIDRSPARVVVDVGAGPGWYLARLLDRHGGRIGLALDVSRAAARRAMRAHARIGAVVADAWGPLPVRDEIAACLLSVFAPRNPAEFRRILAPDGVLVVVTPAPDHLAELVGPLGLVSVDADKAGRLDAQLGPHLVQVEEHAVAWQLDLRHPDVLALVGMGPSAHHLAEEELRQRVAALPDPVAVRPRVRITAYRAAGESRSHSDVRPPPNAPPCRPSGRAVATSTSLPSGSPNGGPRR